jgi:hypothetical protein
VNEGSQVKVGEQQHRESRFRIDQLEERTAPTNPGNNNPGQNNTNLPGNQPPDGGH